MADFSLNIKLNGVEQAVTTVGQIEKALIATRQELKNVQIGSQVFQELSDQAVNLQREFVNSYKETTNFNKNIAELGQSVGSLASTVTAGFTIATSAISLFGIEGEAASEAAAKAQQALALALSATTIATNAKTLAEDLSNVASALGLNLTRANTAATAVETVVTTENAAATTASAVAAGADAVAKTAETAATGAATVAQEGLNVAMAANPIGLVLVGLTALVGALFLFSGGEETAKSNTQETNKVLLEQSDLIKKQSDDFIAVYKLRREVEILSITDAKKRAEETKKLDEEIAGLQGDAVDKQIKRQESANSRLLKDFEGYRDEYIGIRQELVSVTNETDEFGVSIGQSENYRDVEFKIGQQVLSNLKGNLKDRTDEIAAAVKKGTYTQEEGNILTQQAQTQFYIEYLTKQKYFLSQSTKSDDENLKKNLENLIASFKEVRTALEKSYQDRLKIQADAEKKRLEEEQKANDEANRKAEAALAERQRKYKAAYDDIKKTIADTYKELDAIEKKYNDESLKLTFKTKGEEVKFETTEEKKKLDELDRLRKEDITKSVLGKKEKNAALVKLDVEYKQASDALDAFYKLKQKEADAEDLRLKEEKAAKILLIEQTLQTEISFGDQNTADLKETLIVRENQLKLEQLDFEASLNEMSIKEFEAYQAERLSLIKQNNAIKQKIELNQADVDAAKSLGNFIDNLKKEFGAEFVETEKGLAIIKAAKENAETEVVVKKKEINQKYRNEEKTEEEKSADAILQYKLSQLDKYAQFAAQSATTILNLFSAITDLANVKREEELKNLRDFTAAQTDILNESYNEQRKALDDKLAAGVISQEQYNSSILSLDTNLANSTKSLSDKQKAQELAAKKKAFEADKKLKIAQAIISGIQGAISAFTGAFVLGPIAGPIVGGILAGVVAATTAVQVAAIRKTTFDSGSPEITPANTGGAGSGSGSAINQASGGGFTSFNQNLVGTPTTTTTGGGSTPFGSQRVYVVESDITNSQNRVRTLESNSTFG
jgi:hypothetical protein